METVKRHLGQLIACPSVSTESNLDAIGYIAGVLEEAGARVEILRDSSGRKANLWATLGPEVSGGLVLSGHSDVVPVTDQVWATDPFQMIEAEGLLYGRGTCDMKGFIAICLAMAPRLAEVATEVPVHFAFTHDEETGCLGARALVEELAKRDIRPALALIGEPTLMQVIEGHKGCCEYTVRFTGAEGHGSAPGRGVNAVEMAARYIARLLELRQELETRAPADSPFDPPHTTINIGALHGGVAHNVIPGRATLEWEMRPVNAADQHYVKAEVARLVADLLPGMRAVAPQAAIETTVIGEVAGLEPMPENAIRDLVMRLSGANTAACVPFGTEAGLFQALGMQAIVCGPGSIEQAHKPDEYISLDQLAQGLALLHKLADAHGRT
ncbi:acetylornithine deacetylase [Pseudooceanicola sp. CBS1P-1]|uniref:Acetylornithine deacetylase n=1 Tax=Pseudooceanicola albus TaxID=2692189 RepID=A0A6L7G0M5_9RHOB|nr:acetylornithine deacetylase [Pseudooceanicola endophyticus]MXN17631.1 acetylornithine deacetylase [Pseudooceanicola albus]